MRVEDATATRMDKRGVGPASGPTPRDIAQKVPLLRAFCSAMMQDDCSEKHPSWVVPKCF